MAAQLPELLGRKEVAAALGIHPENIGKVPNMPQPAHRISGGQIPVWTRDQIDDLLQSRRAAKAR